MELPNEVKWSSNLEEYFKELGEQSQCYSWLHKRCEAKFAYLSNWIDLPVITLSTVAGTLSIGNSSIFGKDNEQLAGMGIGILSLTVSVMNTIGTYFSWSKRTEAHRLSSIEYAKLYRFLSIELSLPRQERMRPNDLLKVGRDTYERLNEVSPLIPKDIIKQFKASFKKTEDVAKPAEANGLEPIDIFAQNSRETEEVVDATRADDNV